MMHTRTRPPGTARPLPALLRMTLLLHAALLAVLLLQPSSWRWLLGLLLANHALLALAGLWPRCDWLGENWTMLPAASTGRREIALTIDDGPDPEVTPAVLDLLDQYQVKATFFCVGRKARRHPALCRDIVARGHAVENHSERHWHNFSLLGPRGYRRELETAQHTFAAITGRRPQFFRAPAGLRNPFLAPVLHGMGLTLVAWSRRGFDTRSGDAGVVSRRLLPGVRPGAILLLHDGNSARSAAGVPVILGVLPRVLQKAQAMNLRFVTLPQALGDAAGVAAESMPGE